MTTRNSKKRRGSILILSLLFMFLLQLIAFAFATMIPVEARSALKSEQDTIGSLVADAGVTEALAWLRNKIAPPDGSGSQEPMHPSVYPSQAFRTTDMGSNWSYRWELIPDSETYPNGTNNIRAYTIVSRAYRNGRVKREARVQVIQESLSRYAALYDLWSTNLVMGIDEDDAPQGGPVHVNDTLRLWVKNASFWNSTGDPIFSHGLTASGTFNASENSGPGEDGFAYYRGNWNGGNDDLIPYDPANGPIASRYNRMVSGGIENMTAGAAEVPLPTNTFEIRDAAWGFSSPNPLPNTDGVYVNTVGSQPSGGIYVRGEVEEMELGLGGSQPAAGAASSVNYGNNSWVKIEQPFAGRDSIDTHEAVTVLSIDESPVTVPAGATVNGTVLGAPTEYPVGTTLMRNADGTFSHYGGELNGVVYATENIDNLWGTNKGRRTVTVESDLATNKRRDIRIGGHENDSNGSVSVAANQKGLIQYGATDADNDGILDAPETADNVLGLIGYNVLVSSELKSGGSWSNSHPSNNPLYLYATVLAGMQGDGGSYKVESYSSGGAGYTYRYGSRIMAQAGAWGTTSGHGLVEGTTYFDEPASLSPPPYFPTLPSFAIKSYEDKPALDGATL